MTDDQNPLIEIINEYLSVEWMYEGKIVVFKVTSIHRETIDLWVDKYREIILGWETGVPLLTLHDFMEAGSIIMTPHMRRRSTELANLRSDIPTRTAIVMKESLFVNATRIFINSLYKSQKSTRIRKIFFTQAEALDWLLCML